MAFKRILLLFGSVILIWLIWNDTWELKGGIFQEVKPVLRGQLIVTDDYFYKFGDSAKPLIEFAEYDPPATVEEALHFIAPVKESWMVDAKERSNRSSIRLFRTKIDQEPELLLQIQGQKGDWWIEDSMNKIYLLSSQYDSNQGIRKTATHSFWKSTDKGATFTEYRWKNAELGKGYSKGMFFDPLGKYGYIFIGNDVLQTQDGGENWQKIVLPIKTHTETLTGSKIAAVDIEGSLWFSQTVGFDSYIYKIPFDNSEKNLSMLKELFVLPNREIIALKSASDTLDVYAFAITNTASMQDSAAHRYYENYQLATADDESPELYSYHFYEEEVLNTSTIDLSLSKNDFFFNRAIHENSFGQLLVNYKLIDARINEFYSYDKDITALFYIEGAKNRYLLSSQDQGETWIVRKFKRGTYSGGYIDLKAQDYWRYDGFYQLYHTKKL